MLMDLADNLSTEPSLDGWMLARYPRAWVRAVTRANGLACGVALCGVALGLDAVRHAADDAELEEAAADAEAEAERRGEEGEETLEGLPGYSRWRALLGRDSG